MKAGCTVPRTLRQSLFGILLGACIAFALCAAAKAGPAKAGEPFDAAPFGFVENAADGTSYGVRWSDPRKVRKLVVEFAPDATMPPTDKLRVQYWHKVWDGGPDPIMTELNPCAFGWVPMDDWANGEWKNADAKVVVDGRRLTFTFAPTDQKEFKDSGCIAVGYRKTLKIRIASDQPMPRPSRFQTFTDAMLRPVSVRIAWDTPGLESLRTAGEVSGSLEAFNGAIVAVRPCSGTPAKVDPNMHFTFSNDKPCAIEADVMMAVDPDNEESDRTCVTVRTDKRPFSFAAHEAARGDRILVDDLGALVTRVDDPITLAAYRDARKESPRKTVYDRIFERNDQTLMDAWNAMPIRHQIWFAHGLPGNRNAMRQEPNGEVRIWQIARWFELPNSPRDTGRKSFEGDTLALDFGFPDELKRGGRELLDGYLPQLRTWWTDGPIFYEQTTVLDNLESELAKTRMDDPSVLLMRVRVVNTSTSTQGTARLRLTSQAAQPETLTLEGDRVLGKGANGKRLRYILKNNGRGSFAQDGGAIAWTLDLKPGETHAIEAVIPSVNVTDEKELQSLRNRDFDAGSRRVCEYWRGISNRGAEIQTPEPWLNDFYKAHLRHMEINSIRDVKEPRRYAKVSSFGYGVFPNESIMMTADFDRRGCYEAAEQCLQAFLDFQGTVPLPGEFKTQDGVLFGAGGWEHVGYNKHHGYIMWGLAEHWRHTRDRKWMECNADKLIKSCDWITRERKATMTKDSGGKPVAQFGLLPAGGLEDMQDYWYWMATNACTSWGFQALADALSDYGHPEAARLQKESKAYREDVLRAFNDAKVRTPVVRLRDGTSVPKYPSEVFGRGRAMGWCRETLEGSICLLATDLVAPNSPEAAWILKDHEDNLYISNIYGYSIPVFENFWFSRGGFSMQANLLDGPLCYLKRDEISHFLRAYFNGFASAFYPEVRMCNEHCNPELGYPAGDHFKSSDEAQLTYWLRLMFIHENGNDLYLGQAIPRYWLADGQHSSIRNASTYFGPMSLELTSRAASGQIEARFTPPERNPPQKIYLRLRHPDRKPIQGVTLNGQKYEQFDQGNEWVVLPGTLKGQQTVVVSY